MPVGIGDFYSSKSASGSCLPKGWKTSNPGDVRSVAAPPPATTDWATAVGLEDHRQLHQAAHDEAGAPRQGLGRYLQPEAGQAAQQRA